MKNTVIKHHIKNFLRFSLNAVSPLFSRRSSLDAATARTALMEFSPVPMGSSDARNAIMPPSVDLQIVIPAYNAEAYLASCMDSVLSQQTEYSFHIILVDDGSRDSTPAICDRYAADPRVTVIHQQNSGAAAARNTALKELFGRYLMFVDADDLLCPGAVQALLDTAYMYNCDIVEGGMYYLYADGQAPAYHHEGSGQITDPYTLQGYPCGKVFRSALFRNIRFPEGYWYEDSIVSFLLIPSAKISWGIPEFLYAYRVNESGMTRVTHGRPKSVDTYWITEALMEKHHQLGLDSDVGYFRSILQQFRLNQHRVSDLGEDIQEYIFILSCELLTKYFPDTMTDSSQRHLLRALRSRDFGAFKMCCKLF